MLSILVISDTLNDNTCRLLGDNNKIVLVVFYVVFSENTLLFFSPCTFFAFKCHISLLLGSDLSTSDIVNRLSITAHGRLYPNKQ